MKKILVENLGVLEMITCIPFEYNKISISPKEETEEDLMSILPFEY